MNKYSLNRVEGFDPYDYIEIAKNRRGEEIKKADGKPLQYLPTAAKVLWFRMVHPKGILITEQLENPKQEYGEVVSFRSSVLFSPDELAAEWIHQETVWDVAEMDNVVSKVQTIALGKALSKAGFGCEVELALGAICEGDLPEGEEPVEQPKKKRGRPKKTETPEPEGTIEAEVEALLNAAEISVAKETVETPTEKVPEEPDVESKINEYLEMKLETTEKAPINIKKMEGMQLKEILADHKDFGALVKSRPNIRKAISDACAEALIFIEDNK